VGVETSREGAQRGAVRPKNRKIGKNKTSKKVANKQQQPKKV